MKDKSDAQRELRPVTLYDCYGRTYEEAYHLALKAYEMGAEPVGVLGVGAVERRLDDAAPTQHANRTKSKPKRGVSAKKKRRRGKAK